MSEPAPSKAPLVEPGLARTGVAEGSARRRRAEASVGQSQSDILAGQPGERAPAGPAGQAPRRRPPLLSSDRPDSLGCPHRARPASGAQGRPEECAAAAAERPSSSEETTSEVNSEDDALSIASRISQIALEQESKLAGAGARAPPPSPGESQGAAGWPPEIRVTRSEAVRSRARSMAVPRLIEAPPGTIRRNESSSNFSPERGDLRALETSRRSAQLALAALAGHQGGQPAPEVGPARTERAGSLGPQAEAVLNIRRSAWKLCHFDLAFHEAGRDAPGRLAPAPAWGTSAPSLAQPEPAAARSLWALGAPGPLERARSSGRLTSGQAGPSEPQRQQQQQQQQPPQQQQPGALVPQLAGSRRPSMASFGSGQEDYAGSPRRRHPRAGLHFRSAGQPDKAPADGAHQEACPVSPAAALARHLPVLQWLPAYPRHQLLGDLSSGLVDATLNISTSISAAVVADTNPGTAFRASIVSAAIYSLLCSSRHTSFGSLSLMSQLMVVSVKRALGNELILSRLNMGSNIDTWQPQEYERWRLNIIVMFTFLIGLVQLLSGFLNLGNSLASFIPDALGSSLLTAAAFCLTISQLANMCGTSNKILFAIERNTTALWTDPNNPPFSINDLFAGFFRWAQQLTLLVKHHDQINPVCVAISISVVLILFLYQHFVQRQLELLFKRKIFIPIEIILLILMVFLSHHLQLHDNYNVPTCAPISLNLGLPNVPDVRLIRELWFEALATALISYSIVYVVSKQYCNKFNYEVDYNQELIACGAGNLIGGLFDALPGTAAFSRTAAKVQAGAESQMSSLINCSLLLVLAYSFGHYVTLLPLCLTSAALFYSLARLIGGLDKAIFYWRVCKVDFAIWMFNFVAILTVDIINGFVYGFIFSVLTILYRAQNRRSYMLGSIGGSDVYVPLVKYPLAQEIDGIKIFQFCGPIHYVCADLFERLLRQKTRVNVKQMKRDLEKQQAESKKPHLGNKVNSKSSIRSMIPPTHILLDFSMIAYIDSSGLEMIKKIIEDHQKVNITILIASLASHVAAMIKNDTTLWSVYKDRFYVTLADAVHFATRYQTIQEIETVDQKVMEMSIT